MENIIDIEFSVTKMSQVTLLVGYANWMYCIMSVVFIFL